VQKGVEEAMAEGGVHGFPVVDVKVTLLDGKEHSVDSSELAFKLAARLAFREAMAKASPVVLEPVSMVDVDVPADLVGDVLGDLNSRRGKVVGTTPSTRGRQVVSALVPTGELTRYPAELRSLTGGRGRYVVEHHHDEIVPAHLVDKLAVGLSAAGAPGR
jgi:elongation factor G